MREGSWASHISLCFGLIIPNSVNFKFKKPKCFSLNIPENLISTFLILGLHECYVPFPVKFLINTPKIGPT